MTLLRWVLVISVVLFFAGAAAIVAIGYWADAIESVPVTEADLVIGGSYPPEQRQALLDACSKRNVAKREDTCTCIADGAGKDLSPFLRRVLVASLEGSASNIVALTKGLLQSGAPKEKVEGVEKESEQRFDALLHGCGLNR